MRRNYVYDYVMVRGFFTVYDFDTVLVTISIRLCGKARTARKAARLQVRKPYQEPSKHIKTSPGGGWRRIEIVSKPYPQREPYQNRNRKDHSNNITIVSTS